MTQKVSVGFLSGQSRIGYGNSMTVEIADGNSYVKWLIDPGAGVGQNNRLISPTVPDSIYREVDHLLLTHAHLDHFGAVASWLKKPVSLLTGGFTAYYLQQFLSQNGLGQALDNLNFVPVSDPSFSPFTDSDQSGWFDVGLKDSGAVLGMFKMPHSTPESRGLVVFHIPGFGSYVWFIDMNEPETEEEKLRFISILQNIATLEGGVRAVFIDSTAGSREEHKDQPSTPDIRQAICQEIQKTSGVCYFTCFSTDVERIKVAAQEAVKAGRRFGFVRGRSFIDTIALAINSRNEQGDFYLDGLVMPTGADGGQRIVSLEGLEIVSLKEAARISNDPLLRNQLICFLPGAMAQGWDSAGSNSSDPDYEDEGEIASALVRLVKGGLSDQSGRNVLRLQKGDSVIFSSSIIPGSEGEVEELKAGIEANGARVVDYNSALVHISGHDDLSSYLVWLNPKSVVPIHGDYGTRQKMAERIRTVLPETQIVLAQDGEQIVWQANEAGQISSAVSEISGFDAIRKERVKWFGSGLVTLRVYLDDVGLIAKIIFDPKDDITFSLKNMDAIVLERVGFFIRGFLAEFCRTDGADCTLVSPKKPSELSFELKRKLDAFLADQTSLRSVPYMMVKVIPKF